jgi:serine phosphatase RsbU (regulator of sigma subunit)
MPGMDGIEVLKKIKESAEETEIIMITGHGGVETAVTAIKAGAFGYVQKPVEYDELVIEIKRALEKQEMQKSLNEHVHNLELAHAELESLYQQLQREHEMATHVFANVVRRNNIESKYVKYLYSPMDIVGGDLFLSAAGSSGSQYAFLGDFTGHGLSAAIGAIPVSDIFYAMISKGFSIIDIVTEINGKLKKMLPTGLFLCACLIELDCSRDRLIVWNGGLPDALIVGEQGEIKRRLRSTHLPLGVVDNDRLDTSVEVEEVVCEDRLYVYTDGVVEASNKDGEMFGPQRLEECITHIREPERRFDEICSGLVAFRSGAKQRDDIAIAEICCDLGPVEGFDGKAGGEPEEISTIWRLVLELGPDILRMGKSLSHLIDILIGSQKGLYDHRENINLILSELYANALDWGLLGLDSTMKKDAEGFERYYAARQEALATLDDGWIKIDFELFGQDKGGKLVVRVEDSGPGFDYHKTMPELFDNPALGGRGIKLVRSFCKDVVYEGKGNKVKAVYVWE